MKKLTVAGFQTCGAFQQAKQALMGLQVLFPKSFAVTVNEFSTRDEFMTWLSTFRDTLNVPNHKTSPIVWFDQENGKKYLGGRDDTLAWARQLMSVGTKRAHDASANVDTWNPNHGFQYDLVVIGGGSGGLACSKEAAKHGAKVAVLDFVKPSPHGTKWGLGGTCVNVGCIPKKLFHISSTLGEHAEDAKGFGWEGLDGGKNNWETLRGNIQDYIKGLNFGYRVSLREASVTYLNKLGRFLNDHELEVTDAKGKKETIAAARFVIATGGRPTMLNIPGIEHAISSDDIFSLEKGPGKTCVIGAGYVALECAGFIQGLKQGDVTVLVRSKPLRTFDQDTVAYVTKYMKHRGVNIVEGVLPTRIEKLPSGKLKVFYGENDQSDEFDTVLCAIGRTPDIANLGLENLSAPLKLSEKSQKIVTANEQTSIPHVYALGDIIHNAPELTPSAILAGKLLARRLFNNSHNAIDYKDIATAVFTPLELGTVGLTEEEAIAKLGAENVDCYVSAFKPLEWQLNDHYVDLDCYVKVVIDKSRANRVIGIHIAAPNAGEMIQGYGLAMQKGTTYEELCEFVGIHPTTAEELTLLSVSKSSGASMAKKGC